MTPPADPAALLAAVATVRRCESRLSGHPANALEYEAYTAACELLAREFVRRLDAGELV